MLRAKHVTSYQRRRERKSLQEVKFHDQELRARDWLLLLTAHSGLLQGADRAFKTAWVRILVDQPISEYYEQPVFSKLRYHARKAKAKADLEILRLVRKNVGPPEEVLETFLLYSLISWPC